jgi:hypothetical protein
MHENGSVLAKTVPLKSHLWLKSKLWLKSHLFPKRLGLAHALLGVQGGAESLSYGTSSKSKEEMLMSEQARRVKNENIAEWAQGLYFTSGLIEEVLVYHDEEAIYFEHKGEGSGIVRFPFEMLEGLKMVEEENGHSPSKHLGE